jgi:hypothetical protein
MPMRRKGQKRRSVRGRGKTLAHDLEQAFLMRAMNSVWRGGNRQHVSRILDKAREAAKKAGTYNPSWEVENDRFLNTHYEENGNPRPLSWDSNVRL